MKKRHLQYAFIGILGLLLLSGCIPGDGSATPTHPAGFFLGIWHGWLAPLSLLIGLFDRNIRLYEPINTGWFYDLGFYMAVISGFGSLALFRRRKRKHDRI